jgi:hypothetical protein
MAYIKWRAIIDGKLRVLIADLMRKVPGPTEDDMEI